MSDVTPADAALTQSLTEAIRRTTACLDRWNHWTTLRTVTIALGFATTLAATFLSAVPKDQLQALPWWLHPLILGLVAAFTALTTALTSYYDTVAKKLVEAEACLAKLESLQASQSAGAISADDGLTALAAIRDNYPSVAEYQPLFVRPS